MQETLEPLPLSARKLAGLFLLAIALVILPSLMTDKRISLKPVEVSLELHAIEESVEAVSLKEVTPNTDIAEPVPEAPQAPVQPEVVQTPPPAPKPEPQPVVEPTPPAITGGKLDWLTASNIPRRDWHKADWLITRESSWNPNAQNPNSSAYGLKQFLDSTWAGVGCNKADAVNNPVYQLNCGQTYVMNRYGSWDEAIMFWRANKWY